MAGVQNRVMVCTIFVEFIGKFGFWLNSLAYLVDIELLFDHLPNLELSLYQPRSIRSAKRLGSEPTTAHPWYSKYLGRQNSKSELIWIFKDNNIFISLTTPWQLGGISDPGKCFQRHPGCWQCEHTWNEVQLMFLKNAKNSRWWT